MRRLFRIIAEWIAALVGVSAVALGLFVWWITTYPPDSAALTPYIESALNRFVPDTHVEVQESLLTWDGGERSLVLKSTDIKLRDGKNNLIAEFPAMKLKASLLGLISGRLVPSEIKIERPHLWFVRKADGQVMFGDMAAGGAQTPNTEVVESIPFKQGMHNLLESILGEGLLHDLSITDAALSVHDEVANKDWRISVPEIILDRGWRGVAGKIQIAITQQDHDALAEAHYEYNNHDEQHHLNLNFNNINLSFLAGGQPHLADMAMFDLPISGEIAAVMDDDLNIVGATAKINGGEGHFVAPDFWDEPRAVKSLTVSAMYDKASHRLLVPDAMLNLGGPQMTFHLEGEAPKEPKVGDKNYDMDFNLGMTLRDLPMDSFTSVWPKPAVPGARDWISRNMSKGQFTQGEVTLRGKFAWNDIGNMLLQSANGTISARDGRVTYLPGMPAVENVGADGVFDLDHMDVKLLGGGLGALKLLPSTVQMTDFQSHIQNIILPVSLSGPVRDVIKLLDAPPLGYAKAVGLRADDGDGTMEGVLELRFPLLNSILMKDVAIKADAKLTGFGAKKLVPGMEISQGNLALQLNEAGFSLEGPAALNKVPLQVKWEGHFKAEAGKPQYLATITGNVAGEQWRQLGLAAMAKSQGPTAISINLAQPDKNLAQMSGTLDFRQAALQVDELGWKKAAGTPAILNFAADMPKDGPVKVMNIALAGTGVKAKGTAMLDGTSMDLLELDLVPLVVGRTNATIHFKQDADKNSTRRVTVSGKSFDVSGLKSGGKEKPAPDTPVQPAPPTDTHPLDFTIKLGKLYTSASGFIANAEGRARRDALGWSEIDLRGLADGDQPMSIVLKPTTPDPNGPRTFNVTCDDFGKFLKGVGLTETVRGGAINIRGQSEADNSRIITGKMKIGSFTVSDLPVLARLLSAVSPFGIIDLITGEATLDNLRGRFRWNRNVLELKSMRASGAVFGLNIDGQIDLDSGNSALRGTVVPFSFFNSVINKIPLLGDVITGGEGQGVIAAAYTIKGPLSEPDISVNPVSLLTPGFLRDLFFSGDDGDVELPPAEPVTPQPAVAP